MTWIVVASGFALLVFPHELGHFSVARLVGMRSAEEKGAWKSDAEGTRIPGMRT